ncbi:MAG TPA: polysaccharide deacetylase [Firmicutes bacterium]|nr:polysaccharide deacetylase [Bacillota bacterium]
MGKYQKIIVAVLVVGIFFGLGTQIFKLQATVQALIEQNEQLQTENAALTIDLELARQEAQLGEQTPTKPMQPKFAYLTFDDGPSANTEQILNILQEYGVKATFFVIGSETEYGKHLYRRIVEEGHAIGLHSYNHVYADIYKSEEAFMESMYKLRNLIENTTGVRPDILRFPGGSNTSFITRYGGPDLAASLVARLHREGMQYFDWNVSSLDATKPVVDTKIITEATLRGAQGRNQAIVLMHDAPAKKTTVEALPAIIEGLQAQGYTFEVLKRDTPPVHFRLP